MRLLTILSVFSLISLSLSACVTTREQWNQQRGISGEAVADDEAPSTSGKSVQSEDLKEKNVPKVLEKAPAEKAAPPMTADAPETSAPKNTISESAVKPAPITEANAATAGSGPAQVVVPNAMPAAVAASTPASAFRGDLSKYSDDELRVEVARLSGQVEELQHDQQTKDRTYQDEMKKATDHIADLEKKLKELQPDTPTLPAGMTPLAAGKQAFLDGKYDEAVVFMSQVMEKQDTGKDAEEASYIRGESYFKKQQYNKAIVDFSRFPEKFQKSSFHPKALLRIAECFEAMGRKDDAKAFYSDLADKFPKTAEGKLAKKRMKSKV